MELIGEQFIGAPRRLVWEALNDPDILARCIPGCEEVTRVSDAETLARVTMKVGPVRARFSGKILMTDIEAPARCTLNFEGASGAAGFAKGRSAVALIAEGAGTRLTYTVEASVGGKLGQIGGRLIDASAKKMADEFFTAFDTALQDAGASASAGQAGAADGAIPTPAPMPSALPAASPARTVTAVPQPSRPAGNGLQQELYRVLWFGIGVASTLLMTRWLP